MQEIQLYINSQLVDLGEYLPALTYQINDLADVSTANGNTSNQFKIPLTNRNRVIFGLPSGVQFTTIAPYRPFPAKLTISGIEVIPSGFAEIRQVNDDTIDIQVISGNTDFFDAIGYSIHEMGDSTSIASGYGSRLLWKPYDHTWGVPAVAGSQNKTDGWIYPLIDYGASSLPLTPFTGQINCRNMRPSFFLHTAIDLIIASAGYSVDTSRSSLMRDPLYQKLLIPMSSSSFEHGSDFQNSTGTLSVTNNPLSQQFISYPGSAYAGTIPFNQQVLGPFTENLEGTIHVFGTLILQGIPTGKYPSMVHIDIGVAVPGYPLGTVTSQRFEIVNNDPSQISLGGGRYQKTFPINISYDAQLAPETKITVTYGVQGSTYTYFQVLAGAQFQFITSQQDVLWGQTVQCERIFPDIGMTDLLKDTLQRFGTICQANLVTKQIAFASFKDIVANIPNAKDWTNKCVNMGKQTTFQLGSYNQVNKMQYQQDSAIPITFMPRYFADDVITVDDKTLNPGNPVGVLFQSQFGPSLQRPFYGGTTARMSDPNSTDAFSVGSAPRILVDQKYTLAPTEIVTLADNDAGYSDPANTIVLQNTTISIPYFYKPDGACNLCYSDKPGVTGILPGFKTKYWTELQGVLSRAKKVTRYFMLTPRDIYELDLFVPVYVQQDNSYYYINKIDSWVKGVPCKVELIKIY